MTVDDLGSVHTKPEKFENRRFTLETSNVFPLHYAGGIEKCNITRHFEFVFGKNSVGQGDHVIITGEVIVSKDFRFPNFFSPHENKKLANSSG